MIPPLEIRTHRLHLRPLGAEDFEDFAALHADSRVMETLSSAPLSRDQSRDALSRLQSHAASRGYGFWTVALAPSGEFVGVVGLAVPSFEAAFTPCVGVEWRLVHRYWSRGFATEAATAALRYAFEELRLPEILAWTSTGNVASRRVMAKLGMTHDPAEDFDHPGVPVGSPLREHVLYRIRRHSFIGTS